MENENYRRPVLYSNQFLKRSLFLNHQTCGFVSNSYKNFKNNLPEDLNFFVGYRDHGPSRTKYKYLMLNLFNL